MTDTHSSAEVRGVPPGSLMDHMGMEVLECTAQRCVIRMPVLGNTQTRGVLHGGASAALAETAGSMAATEIARSAYPDESAFAVGVDLNITHHRPGRQGWVTATAVPASTGKTLVSHEVHIIDDAQTRIATARITNMILRNRASG